MVAISQEVGFRPMVNTAIANAGCVVAHARVIDCMGRFHGLIRLVIDGSGHEPNAEIWQEMLLKGAVIKAVIKDETITSRIVILYKLEEQP